MREEPETEEIQSRGGSKKELSAAEAEPAQPTNWYYPFMRAELPETKNKGKDIGEDSSPSATDTPSVPPQASSPAPEPEITYDFPITMNREVKKYINLFQHGQRYTFKKWLERSGKYLPLIKRKLKQKDLPLDLAYLPLIESGYILNAYSSSHAAGPWQFIESTARNYDLQINSYIDERYNPVKATEAAIGYLSDLYREFGDWQLAAAAYNGGKYKVMKGIRQYNTKNFWELAQKPHLFNETKNYVPKLIAAILIAKNPEKYGFDDLNYADPLDHDTIKVEPWTSLRKIAVACDTDLEEIKELNQELKKQVVPAVNENFRVKIPAGKKELASRNLPKVHAVIHTSYKTHVAQRDENLSDICRRYNLNKTTILKANNLESARLKKGQRLRIPFQTKRFTLLDTPPSRVMAAEDGFILHQIKPGETLSQISLKYRVPIRQIASWNNLKDVHGITAGDKLALYITNDNPSVPHLNRDRTGDQQMALADRHYKVKKGDSLWEISKRHGISVEKIKSLNNLQDNLIHPETRLLLLEKEQSGG
ncbi:MAG: LysM peptidoglycan-binding domain-containing protein [Desulfurivibrionaceae bacterium]